MNENRKIIERLDVQIAVSVVICYLTGALLNALNVKAAVGNMNLEIIQKMTACITCLLCCQETRTAEKKAGINRLIITAIGGIMGIGVVALDNLIGNRWILAVLIFAGILLTFLLCKVAKVPYVNARIGGVTFVLVTLTLSGPARMVYAALRFVSTLYGVLVVTLVGYLFSRIGGQTE